jgi:hypothetical protein
VKVPGRTRLRWLPVAARAALSAELALAIGCFLFLGFHLFGDVFAGSPPALTAQLAATCESTEPASSCHASVMELYRGRYRVTTDVAAARLTLVLEPQESTQRAKALLVRLSQPAAARLESRSTNASAATVVAARVVGSGFRAVLPLPQSAAPIASLAFVAEPGAEPQPFMLDEVGLFENDHGLLNDVRPWFAWVPASRFYATLVPRALSRLFVLCVIGFLVVSAPTLRKLSPWMLGVVCFGCCLLDLAILFSPYGTHDLRLFYASGTLQEAPGANLNVALWQGFRLLQGEGLTYASHAVPWSRMPGYGLFCAVAGALFGHRTMLDLAIGTVLLQVLFYCVALMCLASAAARLWPAQAVLTVGLLIAFLPKELGYTQVDAIIAPIAMLVTAALCLRISASRQDQGVPPRLDVLVHATFALWFLMRPDVLPGWIAVSLALHWRNWRRLLIPAILFLAIGFSWGAYRSRYTNEFTLTTSSAGASLFCGLWEVPSRFAPTCSDQSYFTWIAEHSSFNPLSTPANDFTVREVLRFWLTYPGHFVAMLDHKMMLCVDSACWPGLRTFLHESLFYLLVWPPRAIVGLLTIIGLCVAVDHERRRTLLFGWPLWFNAPLFWVLFASDGRFYGAIPIALLAAGVPPLFEGRFYSRLAARPWRTLSVLACAGILVMVAWPFHDWLLRADAFHYWTPFLDPSRSQLSGFK